MLISKAFYRHLPIFLNISKCPLRGIICMIKLFLEITRNNLFKSKKSERSPKSHQEFHVKAS
jgi:hypothetical protein